MMATDSIHQGLKLEYVDVDNISTYNPNFLLSSYLNYTFDPMNYLGRRSSLLATLRAYRKPHQPWKMHQTLAHNIQKKKTTHLAIAAYGLVFVCCFAMIPLYRLFCEHVGLSGNNDKKIYDFKGKKVNNIKKYIVKFTGIGQMDVDWVFEPVQTEVVVSAAETAIVFYKIYNKTNEPIVGFSIYNVSPESASTYFSKIQCFCFNQQLISPKEQLLLPLFFYLQPQINEDPNTSRINQIKVDYRFFKSNKQDLAKYAKTQLKKLEQNKRTLHEMRAKKAGLSLQQYQSKLDQEEEEVSSYQIAVRQAVKSQVESSLAKQP